MYANGLRAGLIALATEITRVLYTHAYLMTFEMRTYDTRADSGLLNTWLTTVIVIDSYSTLGASVEASHFEPHCPTENLFLFQLHNQIETEFIWRIST